MEKNVIFFVDSNVLIILIHTDIHIFPIRIT